jgi:hypothetical protein
LFSLVQPWLRKFRGLSKQGLEQAAHTFGIIRSLTLSGESVESAIDCVVIGWFPQFYIRASYLEFTFGEDPNTIIETLREDSRLKDVHGDELRTVARAQINQ